MLKIRVESLEEIKQAAKDFLAFQHKGKVFAFYGGMGAGKTTFIKAICLELGVEENISSPTFSIVNEYITPKGESIFHFDCYRLRNIREAYDFGAEEYFYSGSMCFVEWPEILEELLPSEVVKVRINVIDENIREIEIDG
jgi:tRNA threonylcarbamoyladenosine biosynthesis protein TsaE